MKQDISPANRHEATPLMEPLRIPDTSRHRAELSDLAFTLAQKSAGFRRSLPPSIVASLADLVRAMNCYYSNLIEGHNTHPIDIERAIHDDYSADARKRDLQLEAKAHIAVQAWIDSSALPAARALSPEGIRDVHRQFCERLPDDLLWVEDSAGHERVRVIPGEFRTREVQLGRHVAISPGAVPRFLDRYHEAYSTLGKAESILACAAAHHRLLWIHPFMDGNGRVARLISHAILLDILDTGAIWSVARGMAQHQPTYFSMLSRCDQTSDEEALIEFTRFFLTICIDQVDFMESLVQPDRLRTRILLWAEEETRLGELPPRAGAILEALLYRGELPRGDLESIVGTGERQARRVASALVGRGILTSESPRAPLRLAFPARLAGRWLPGLFPDQIS